MVSALSIAKSTACVILLIIKAFSLSQPRNLPNGTIWYKSNITYASLGSLYNAWTDDVLPRSDLLASASVAKIRTRKSVTSNRRLKALPRKCCIARLKLMGRAYMELREVDSSEGYGVTYGPTFTLDIERNGQFMAHFGLAIGNLIQLHDLEGALPSVSDYVFLVFRKALGEFDHRSRKRREILYMTKVRKKRLQRFATFLSVDELLWSQYVFHFTSATMKKLDEGSNQHTVLFNVLLQWYISKTFISQCQGQMLLADDLSEKQKERTNKNLVWYDKQYLWKTNFTARESKAPNPACSNFAPIKRANRTWCLIERSTKAGKSKSTNLSVCSLLLQKSKTEIDRLILQAMIPAALRCSNQEFLLLQACKVVLHSLAGTGFHILMVWIEDSELVGDPTFAKEFEGSGGAIKAEKTVLNAIYGHFSNLDRAMHSWKPSRKNEHTSDFLDGIGVYNLVRKFYSMKHYGETLRDIAKDVGLIMMTYFHPLIHYLLCYLFTCGLQSTQFFIFAPTKAPPQASHRTWAVNEAKTTFGTYCLPPELCNDKASINGLNAEKNPWRKARPAFQQGLELIDSRVHGAIEVRCEVSGARESSEDPHSPCAGSREPVSRATGNGVDLLLEDEIEEINGPQTGRKTQQQVTSMASFKLDNKEGRISEQKRIVRLHMIRAQHATLTPIPHIRWLLLEFPGVGCLDS
ncbi:uncharacterized protein BDR25DRAFT_362720 [Lindgomyces ingoldianus]|uniref:Uncharacterized protein n=1 Tax=Lindgomyces ingoldianus TaxID=673940 RepID=A0ACB6QBS2_9PLEO|nr:uncharacterized protein BDR25DRAFT_362720 [Lindgomyces ingoldianus]KAF2463552.1 hypothetical protein BDR25DRAFT_362720 [Lindgomyces ingoldianus]